jgi:hypothetical protein
MLLPRLTWKTGSHSCRWMRIVALPACTLSALTIVACARSGSAPSISHSTTTVSACSPEDATSRAKPATLVVTFRPEPAAAADAQANIRVLGPDAYRADVDVSVAGGTRLDLPRGTYDVRIALRGYESVVGRAALTGGCTAELVANLRK